MKKPTISHIVIIFLLFVIGGIGIKGCKDKRQIKSLVKDKMSYEHKADTYEAKNGQLVSYNKVLETSLETLELTNDSLVGYLANIKIKDPEYVTIVDTEYLLDTIFIPTETVIPCDSNFLVSFSDSSEFYNIAGSVQNDGVNINKISFPNRTTVTLGRKKVRLFKHESIVAVTQSNPYMNTEAISTYTFPEEKKWYQRTWIKITAGAILGGVVTYKVVK